MNTDKLKLTSKASAYAQKLSIAYVTALSNDFRKAVAPNSEVFGNPAAVREAVHKELMPLMATLPQEELHEYLFSLVYADIAQHILGCLMQLSHADPEKVLGSLLERLKENENEANELLGITIPTPANA